MVGTGSKTPVGGTQFGFSGVLLNWEKVFYVVGRNTLPLIPWLCVVYKPHVFFTPSLSQLTSVLVHLGNQLGLHVIAVPTALAATFKVVQIYIGSNFSNPGFPLVTTRVST